MKLCKLQGETQVGDQQQWIVFGENQQAQDLITHRRGFCCTHYRILMLSHNTRVKRRRSPIVKSSLHCISPSGLRGEELLLIGKLYNVLIRAAKWTIFVLNRIMVSWSRRQHLRSVSFFFGIWREILRGIAYCFWGAQSLNRLCFLALWSFKLDLFIWRT